MSDQQLALMISSTRFVLPSVIARRAGRRSINAQLGRLIRSGVIERVLGSHCYMYRSMQAALI